MQYTSLQVHNIAEIAITRMQHRYTTKISATCLWEVLVCLLKITLVLHFNNLFLAAKSHHMKKHILHMLNLHMFPVIGN